MRSLRDEWLGLRDRRAALARAAVARLPRRRERRGVAVPRVPRDRGRRCCRRASAASRSPASSATRSGSRPTASSSLYEALIAAGDDLGLTHFGARALHSLRLEKSFGTWAREYRPIYTPAEAGLDRFVAIDKGDFIGRAAVLRDRQQTAGARAW